MLDLEMPTMNGIETFKILRKIFEENKFKTKIVACSGYAKDKLKLECLNIGMDDYLEKPLRKEELDRVLRNYM